MPLVSTRGAASAQGFGEFAQSTPPVYIEDVFSIWLYTGTGANQTINNGIDLAGRGGLVWVKNRASSNHALGEPNTLGFGTYLSSSTTAPATGDVNTFRAFNSNGFTIGSSTLTGASANNYVSWTFREQPKFFDVVTYTGDGTANRNIAHNLGSAPGFVIIKRTNNTSNWCVAARLNSGDASFMMLNRTVAQTSTASSWFNGTTFKVGTSDWPSSTGSPDFFGYDTNGTGDTYVAYLFAHNAGGFGLTGTDNVISCGSYTGTGAAGNTVNLGYEPQLVIIKGTSTTGWSMFDSMRGFTVEGADALLTANTSSAESSVTWVSPTATGFSFETGSANVNASGNSYVYIAIRRGPMRVPTTGTSVFSPSISTGTGTDRTITTNFPVDLSFLSDRSAATNLFIDRLRGGGVDTTKMLYSNSTSIEDTSTSGRGLLFSSNTSITLTSNLSNVTGTDYVYYALRRAPGFFDEVCYTGNDVARNLTHNLGAVPELWIVKIRSASGYSWAVGGGVLGSATNNFIILNSTSGSSTLANFWATPTTTTFGFGSGAPSDTTINQSGQTYVAYLFASCPGVSKVGSYTGNGSSQTINCGFTGGARFVMVKRTNSTGNWMVVDTARGLVSAGDPTLYLNSTAAEVTGVDWLDPASSGFIVNQDSTMNANVNGATYIFLAIA